MREIQHIGSAFLLLFAGAALFYSTKILLSNEFVAEQKEETPLLCGNINSSNYYVGNAEGRSLFSNNCQTCHALDKVITGPALRDVEERGPWGNRENLVKWIHNPGKFSTKDAYTKGLVAQYGQLMTAFPQLTKEQIFSIFDYIKGTPSPGPVPTVIACP